MIKIREVTKTISSLPPKKLARFRAWFTKFDPVYHRQIEQFQDAIGKIRRGEKELRNGKTKIVHSLAELR